MPKSFLCTAQVYCSEFCAWTVHPELISGISTATAFSSPDCYLFKDISIPISIQRSMLTLLLPFAFMILLFLVWLAVTMVKKCSYTYLWWRVHVSNLVIVYIMYVGITQGSLRVLQNVHVEVSDDSGAVLGHTQHWAHDTSSSYLTGSHAVLAYTLGIPMLVVFSIGFPLCTTLQLVFCKESQYFRSSTFLYVAYKPKFAYWEMVILTRKALLVAVTVLCVPLGSNLQGILAVLVMTAALSIQLYAMPYKEEVNRMNYREALSLCISGMIYIFSLALNDEHISGAVKTVSSVVIISVSFAFVASQLVLMVTECARHIDTILVTKFIEHPSGSTATQKAWIICKHYWSKYGLQFESRTESKEIVVTEIMESSNSLTSSDQ